MSAEGEITFDALRQMSPEQLDQVGYASMMGNTGAALTPYILGLFMDAMLLGVVLMQVSRWFTYCHGNERWIIRGLVYYVVLINIAITIFLVKWNFELFVYNFGRYRQFVSIDYASFFYLIDTLVRTPVSAFFAERAWRMAGKNKILGAVLLILLIASMIIGIANKVLATTIYGSSTFIAISCAWLACHLASDAITTTTIGLSLYRSNTGWKQTDALVMQLLMMTAETQFPPTILSLAFLITYVANTHTAWPIFFVFSAKVFAICLIAVLNTKFTLRRELETNSTVGGNNTYALKSRTKQPSVQVHVMTETYREREEGYGSINEMKRKPVDDVESVSAEKSDKILSLSEMDYEAPTVRFT